MGEAALWTAYASANTPTCSLVLVTVMPTCVWRPPRQKGDCKSACVVCACLFQERCDVYAGGDEDVGEGEGDE